MRKIYALNMYGWESSRTTLLTNDDKEYSEIEYKELVSYLYVEESYKRIKVDGNYEHYKSGEYNYDSVLKRLIKDYNFIIIKSDIDHTINEDNLFDSDYKTNGDIKIIREKYKSYIRIKKLERITK